MMKPITNFLLYPILIIFTALLFFNCSSPTKPKPPEKPDTTTHNIVWEVDTIGDFQSRLRDVWGSSPENIWAVGFVYLDDWGTNIMHYNGEEWEEYDYFEADLRAIYGFSTNDVWAVGNNLLIPDRDALVAHYDGSTWKTVHVGIGVPILQSIWGSSSNNIFAVGIEGTILHYDGSKWEKMNSGVYKHLRDVWGFAPDDVYVAGGSSNEATDLPILLHYDGTSWTSILDTVNNKRHKVTSLWGSSNESLYFSATYGFQHGSKETGWSTISIPDDNTSIRKLRGSGNNNIFITGPFGLVIHYNGVTWHRYDEIFSKTNPYGPTLVGIMPFEDMVFIVGTNDDAKAVVYKGCIKN
jgi:hypothetical protein